MTAAANKDFGGNKYLSKHQLGALNRFRKRYQGLKTQVKRVLPSHNTSMTSSRRHSNTPKKNNFMEDGSQDVTTNVSMQGRADTDSE